MSRKNNDKKQKSITNKIVVKRNKTFGEEIATLKIIDCEIKKVINESKEKCEEILKNNTDQLEIIAQALLKYETLTGDEIKKLLNGEEIQQEQEIKIEAGHSLIAKMINKKGN